VFYQAVAAAAVWTYSSIINNGTFWMVVIEGIFYSQKIILDIRSGVSLSGLLLFKCLGVVSLPSQLGSLDKGVDQRSSSKWQQDRVETL
jgi:hypothetical protein